MLATPPGLPLWPIVIPGKYRSRSTASPSLRSAISSRGTIVTLLPCSVSGTSIADPATRTESTCGAIFKCTISGSGADAPASGMLFVSKPGAVMARCISPVPESFSVKPPAWSVVVCWATPKRLTAETCAPAMAAPDGSSTVPLMVKDVAVAAGNSPSHKTRKRIVGSSLESRNYGVLPVGLLTCASTGRSAFPSVQDSGSHRPVLHAYSGGAVLDLHQLPNKTPAVFETDST